MSKFDIKSLAKKLQNTQEKVLGESFYIALVREACKGIEKQGNDKSLKSLETGAYLGLSEYYPAWGDWMNKKFAKEIAEIIYDNVNFKH